MRGVLLLDGEHVSRLCVISYSNNVMFFLPDYKSAG